MDYETFERKVAERAGVSREQARQLIRATLETLADRVTAGEAHDVASQLPGPAKEWFISSEPEAERFGLDEFIRRVSERGGAPPGEARTGAQAVLVTLRQAITGGEFRDLMSQLPREFSELVGT
jgi:uncharacterized protein (DUF2267 family)